MQKSNLLIVDDNQELLLALKILFRPHFKKIDITHNPETLSKKLKNEFYHLILLDMNFKAGIQSGNEGLYWMRQIHKIEPNSGIVFITAYGDLEIAVNAIKEGAIDFIEKSWNEEKILATILRAQKHQQNQQEISRLKVQQKHLNKVLDTSKEFYLGQSPLIKKLYEMINKVAPTDAAILLYGANGTGKEVIARQIHQLSAAKEEIFIRVDLGALHSNLFETELFGHVKGAFTDAKEDKAGRFELASGGTLFLDEVNSLPLPQQVKLLSVLQLKQVNRVGSSRVIPVNFRLICACNEPLTKLIEQGKFREDLYYRINTIELNVPSLNERSLDIRGLARFFVIKYANKYKKNIKKISENALEKLTNYSWPGNIRELAHIIEKAVILNETNVIKENVILFSNQQPITPNINQLNLNEVEKSTIRAALTKYEWNMSQTARALGINRSTLYDKIKKYGI